jgi:Tol biopolymer transport system component
MAQALDCRRLELSGERMVVVPQVRHQRWRQADFSVSSNGVLLYQGAQHQQLSWFDRQGNLLKAVGPPNDCLSFALSPDERYVALHRHDDPDTVLPTIWVMDLWREGAVFRFTDTDIAQPEFTAVWSPDSREILFSRGDDRRMRLFRRSLNGGAAQCVLDTEGPKFPSDWSSDGNFVAYTSQVPDYRTLHVWTLALSGSEKQLQPRPFVQHFYEEHSAQFSPADDGEAPSWLAYSSHETGRHEIYVRDFPGGSHKWQVSSQGGAQPHWRRDGRELFYLRLDGTLMSVPVNLGSGFDFGAAHPLFSTGLRYLTRYTIWMNQYSVSRDGQRFLLNRHLADATQGAITAVIPW